MEAVSTGLYIAAFLFAIVDGAMADKGTYPSGPGRTGLRFYSRLHPWIVVGALCGVAGVIVDLLA